MKIGHGDMASVLPERDDLLFFASGVSNSLEERESEYKREIDLLLKQNKNKHIVYFSSLSVFYKDSRYTKHKIQIERLIKEKFKHYTIFRLGNITWGTNPHTIINSFRDKIKKGQKLEIRDEYRYITDKEEFLHWLDLIPLWNCEMNVTGQKMKIKDLINKYGYLK